MRAHLIAAIGAGLPLTAALVGPLPVPMQLSDGGVSAAVTATAAELSDGRIARRWSLGAELSCPPRGRPV